MHFQAINLDEIQYKLYIADKNRLPVTELRFGDTGDGTNREYGYHTLGKLQCWG